MSSPVATEGYRVQLVDGPIERYRCPECKLLLRQPLQATCGDLFCSACVTNLFSSTTHPVCPVDLIPLEKTEMFRDMFTDREIQQLKVYCSSRPKYTSCDWTGELRMLAEHKMTCRFIDQECPNSGCSAAVPRYLLGKHLSDECPKRVVECLRCSGKVPACQLEAHLATECDNSPVYCPNNCTTSPLLRKQIENHLQTCPLQVVSCFYSQVGCTFKEARQGLPSHHATNLAYHLQLMFKSFQISRGEISDLQQQKAIMEKRYECLEEKVTRLAGMLEQISNTTNTSVTLVENTTTSPQRTKEAKPFDHNGFAEGVASVSAVSSSSTSGFHSGSDSYMREMESRILSAERTLALHDVQMSDLNIRQDLTDVKTTTGVLVWKVGDFSRRQRDAVSGKVTSLYSPPFYTSPCGYKLCARLYPNGDGIGRGSHLSLFFVVMRGEYDALLQWPFQQRVTLSLLDQSRTSQRHVVETFCADPSSSSFHRPQGDMNVASGCPCFLPLSSVRGSYLKDETLFFKVIVNKNHLVSPDDP